MIKAAPRSQADFYREFLMGRGNFSPLEFGVELTRDALMDLMVEEFNVTYRDTLTIDELLLHPREATRFCDLVRGKHSFYDLPDDIILRSVMNRRKNPGGSS